MKKIIILALLGFCSSSFAWISNEKPFKEYVFKFKLAGQIYETKNSAASYEEAFEVAAQKCFNHYKGSGKISENKGLDIIDVCANPRS